MSQAEAIARLQTGAEQLRDIIDQLNDLEDQAEGVNTVIQMAYNDVTGNVISASLNIRKGKTILTQAVGEFLLAHHSIEAAITRLHG